MGRDRRPAVRSAPLSQGFAVCPESYEVNHPPRRAEGGVVVLGAYGLIGRELVRFLVEKTKADVVAAGRNPERLHALTAEMDAGRVRSRELDARDLGSVTAAAADASLVINCVGPYLDGGSDVAAAALEAGASYVDLASEQEHYRRLQKLSDRARKSGQFLFAGAGLFPGLSGVLAEQGSRFVPEVDSIEILYAQGRMPEADAGLGSFMTGILEACQETVVLRNGERVPHQFGATRRRIALPDPFGPVETFEVPTLETFTLADSLGARSVSTWAHFGEIPAWVFTLVRALRPDRRPWANRLLQRLTKLTMERDFARAAARGIGTEAWLQVTVDGADRRWRATFRFPEGGSIPTAYLPAIAAKRFLEDRLTATGLVTAIDVFDLESLLAELGEVGWKLEPKIETQEARAGTPGASNAPPPGTRRGSPAAD